MATTSYTFHVNTGLAIIQTANPNLDGTGALGLVITGATASGTSVGGTLVKTITIKAVNSTTQGMVRLFKTDGINFRLLLEV